MLSRQDSRSGSTSGGSTSGSTSGTTSGSTGGGSNGPIIESSNGATVLIGTATQVTESGISNPTWSFSSPNVIKNYITLPNNSSQIIGLSSSDLSGQTSVTFYDWKPETVNATCSGNYQGTPVQASIQIVFEAPTLFWVPESGYVQEHASTGFDGWELGPDMSPQYMLPYGMNYQPPPNILWSDQSWIPGAAQGFSLQGSWQLLQIITPNRLILANGVDSNGNETPQANLITDTLNDVAGLDGFPIGDGDIPFQDFSTAYETVANYFNTPIDYKTSDIFTTYAMFQPPPSGYGPSIWVPISQYPWSFDTNATYNGSSKLGAWSETGLPDDESFKTNVVAASYLPMWTVLHYNGEYGQ